MLSAIVLSCRAQDASADGTQLKQDAKAELEALRPQLEELTARLEGHLAVAHHSAAEDILSKLKVGTAL